MSIANCSIELSKENLMRLGRVLLPPDAEVLSTYCKQVNDLIFDDDRVADDEEDRHSSIVIIRVLTTRCGSCRSGT